MFNNIYIGKNLIDTHKNKTLCDLSYQIFGYFDIIDFLKQKVSFQYNIYCILF